MGDDRDAPFDILNSTEEMVASVFSENKNGLVGSVTVFHKYRMEQISDPFRIVGVIFVVSDSFYPFGIGKDNIDFIFQKIENRNPVFICGLHTNVMTIIVEKPLTELLHN